VLTASGPHEESADLVSERGPREPGARPLVVLRLRPTSMLDACALTALLRRKFFHVADMLDPGFEYRPDPLRTRHGPAGDALLLSRYRAAWEACIEGRMHRRGWSGPEARARSLTRFAAAYSLPEDGAGTSFASWFACTRPRHHDLILFAQHPYAQLESHTADLHGARATP
jgi:hypothetical protein